MTISSTIIGALVVRLAAVNQRENTILQLGAKTEQDALSIAKRHLRHASTDDITAALQAVERCKLKTYASVKAPVGISPEPYAGIVQTLSRAKITLTELDAWIDTIKRTTFANGNKYQPLPSHDEAWQTFSAVSTELRLDKQLAHQIINQSAPKITDQDIINACKWDLWDHLPHQCKQQAWRIIPENDRAAIKLRYPNNPSAAMQATKDYHSTKRAAT
jgi:hypothetical protein